MKTSFKFLSACIIAAALVGCQGNRYNIDGRTGEEWADGTIFCIPAGQRNAAALDSATINADGTFVLQGACDTPQVCLLSLQKGESRHNANGYSSYSSRDTSPSPSATTNSTYREQNLTNWQTSI